MLNITVTWWNVIGLTIGLVLLLAWIWIFWPSVAYLLWRMSGGGWRARRNERAASFADLFGLGPKHLFQAKADRQLHVDLPVSGRELRIPPELSASETGIDLRIEFTRVFEVASSRVRRGCHGHYSLAKSFYYNELFGGDPRCGGQKYFFASRLRQWWEQLLLTFRVRNALSAGVIRGIAVSYEQGLRRAAYRDSSKDSWRSSLQVFLSPENEVREFMEQCGNEGYQLVPVTIRIN